jgi:hypothetical protein
LIPSFFKTDPLASRVRICCILTWVKLTTIMNSSIINLFIEDRLSGIELYRRIEGEVAEYIASMAKLGSTTNLYFSEDETIYIDKCALVKLLSEVLHGNVTPQGLAYMCDCFTLSERIDYQNELIKDSIFEIADPEINGGFKSGSELQEILRKINLGA